MFLNCLNESKIILINHYFIVIRICFVTNVTRENIFLTVHLSLRWKFLLSLCVTKDNIIIALKINLIKYELMYGVIITGITQYVI